MSTLLRETNADLAKLLEASALAPIPRFGLKLAIRCGEALLAQPTWTVKWEAKDVEEFAKLREKARGLLKLT